MGAALYREHAVFRAAIDACAEDLRAHIGLDLRETFFPSEAQCADAEKRIDETWLTQPAIFAMEYAYARL